MFLDSIRGNPKVCGFCLGVTRSDPDVGRTIQNVNQCHNEKLLSNCVIPVDIEHQTFLEHLDAAFIGRFVEPKRMTVEDPLLRSPVFSRPNDVFYSVTDHKCAVQIRNGTEIWHKSGEKLDEEYVLALSEFCKETLQNVAGQYQRLQSCEVYQPGYCCFRITYDSDSEFFVWFVYKTVGMGFCILPLNPNQKLVELNNSFYLMYVQSLWNFKTKTDALSSINHCAYVMRFFFWLADILHFPDFSPPMKLFTTRELFCTAVAQRRAKLLSKWFSNYQPTWETLLSVLQTIEDNLNRAHSPAGSAVNFGSVISDKVDLFSYVFEEPGLAEKISAWITAVKPFFVDAELAKMVVDLSQGVEHPVFQQCTKALSSFSSMTTTKSDAPAFGDSAWNNLCISCGKEPPTLDFVPSCGHQYYCLPCMQKMSQCPSCSQMVDIIVIQRLNPQ